MQKPDDNISSEEIMKKEQVENPYDPVNVAKMQGQLYAKGLSGQYRKNLVTRIGFFLIGLNIFFIGALLLIDFFIGYNNGRAFVGEISSAIFAFLLVFLGVKVLRNVFK